MAEAHENPFLWLLAREQLVKQHAKGLPRREKIQKIWRGIAYRLGKTVMVSGLDDIREIIASPSQMAKVPGSKPWVRGIANNRGLLLPVVDLQLCLGGEKPSKIDKQSRLLILNQSGVPSGVLVDEVLGIKHFSEDARQADFDEKTWYASFVRSTFKEKDITWAVFDLHALSKSRQFLDAAV